MRPLTLDEADRRAAEFALRACNPWEVKYRAHLAEGSDDEAPKIAGLAAPFNSISEDLWGFREVIRPGAFTKTLRESDVIALNQHDDKQILGRVSAGNVRVEETDRGLEFEIEPTLTSYARDALLLISKRIVKHMSFAFRAVKDRVTQNEEGETLRELIEVELLEISPVIWPAYTSTEVVLRDALRRFGAVGVAGVSLNSETLLTDPQSDPTVHESVQPTDPAIRAAHRRREIQLAELGRRLRVA